MCIYSTFMRVSQRISLVIFGKRHIVQRMGDNIYGIQRKQYRLSVKKMLYFSKMNYVSPPCLCFHCILPVFSPKVKETISPPCTTIDFLPFPQPVQRMSYFKGQDGGRSQVTSFYRSTPQTSTLPSRARQKAALLRSTGKLPHQSFRFSPQASSSPTVYPLQLHIHIT